MADNFLQAFQVGANLYDRAQNRKMEQAQFQQNAAQFVLQREQQALQQQIGALTIAQKGFELESAKQEMVAQANDMVKFQQFANGAVKYSEDPTLSENAIEFPLLESKQYRDAAVGIYKEAIIKRNNNIAARASIQRDRVAAVEKASALKGLDWLSSNVPGQAKFVHEMSAKLASSPPGELDWDAFSQIKAKVNEFSPQIQVAKSMVPGENKTAATDAAQRGVAISDDMMKRSPGQAISDSARKAQMQVDVLKQRGIEVTPQFAAEIANKATTSGGLSLDAVTKKEFAANDNTVSLLDLATSKIANFNNKYGAGAFDDFVGPIDAPVFQLKGRAEGLKSDAQKEARDIFKDVDVAIQGYRKANFGTALSANEIETFNKIIPPSGYASYSTDFGQFANALRDTMKIAVARTMFSPDAVPFLEKYGPKGGSATGISVPLNGGTFIIRKKQ